jgi:pyruvate/2-oxoglutarate dehydrogenase complex dihydrolipoamide dehydrogenase (E3) component
VAKITGRELAKKLFPDPADQSLLEVDYSLIPSILWTPIPYGFVGMSEEAAVKKFGPVNVIVRTARITLISILFLAPASHFRFMRKTTFLTEE